MNSVEPKSRPFLTLDKTLPPAELTDARNNFSAIVLAGGHLWLGGDEGTLIDRMTPDGAGNFGAHRRFDLATVLALPVPGADSEIDIEGLDFNGGYLWIVGSHSLKRKKAEKEEKAEKNRRRLAKVEMEGNRQTLARVPLDANGEPVSQTGALRSARLEGDEAGDQLFLALGADEHLSRSCRIPSKENGLDIEGLAVSGNRIFAGLRGPVLRGWAVVLEFEWEDAAPGVLALSTPLKKHFLQLDGLGVRELAIRGKDLYILAGPTMDLDGPVFLYRWPNALENSEEALLWRKELQKVLDIPYGTGKDAGRDHAEGIALIEQSGAPPDVMICYDSPAGGRLVEDHPEQVRLDIFALDGVI